MARTATLHVLRVFTAESGSHGNRLGVFLDGAAVPAARRQPIARDLGFSETVFVTDPARAEVFIHTPSNELPFAGHPLVGTYWLLDGQGEGEEPMVLRPPAGDVPAWTEGGDRWIRGRAEWAPPMDLRQYASPAEVEAVTGAAEGHLDAWAWMDEAAGVIRSRVFAPASGIAEDEATGAAAVRLVTTLGRPVEIRQGAGSRLLARPGPDGTAEVGGTVVLDEVREYQVD